MVLFGTLHIFLVLSGTSSLIFSFTLTGIMELFRADHMTSFAMGLRFNQFYLYFTTYVLFQTQSIINFKRKTWLVTRDQCSFAAAIRSL